MFSTLPSLAHNLNQETCYAPRVSSPLSSSPLRKSPLSSCYGNAQQSARQSQFQMSSATPTKNRKDILYSKLVTRANPLIHHRDDGRETRRKLFLKKVKEDSEDRRWEARGGEDEMMRVIWLAEEKRRAEIKARDASYELPLQEEVIENEEASPSSNLQSQDEEMADEIAQQENAEMEALLSMLDDEDSLKDRKSFEGPETPYGSDDDEYDQIFLDVINEEHKDIFTDIAKDKKSKSELKLVQLEKAKEDHDMMDMT